MKYLSKRKVYPVHSMLQHMTFGSMASLSNNFECPRNVQRAGQHTLLYPLHNITRSRTKDLTHLDI